MLKARAGIERDEERAVRYIENMSHSSAAAVGEISVIRRYRVTATTTARRGTARRKGITFRRVRARARMCALRLRVCGTERKVSI